MTSDLIQRVVSIAAECQAERWVGYLHVEVEWSWDGITFEAMIVPDNRRETFIVIDFFTGQARVWIEGKEVGSPELN